MWIQEARESRGWTAHEAARRAGIGDQQLKNLENGKTKPGAVRLETAIALVELYWPDVTLSEFLGDDESAALRFELRPRGASAWAHLIAGTSSKTFLQYLRDSG
jgi:transcriptional regulator with XRE-family HTH domain